MTCSSSRVASANRLFYAFGSFVATVCAWSCVSQGSDTADVPIDVSGLGGTLVLSVQGSELTLTADGTYTFALDLRRDSTYAVTITTQPSGQTCTVTDGEGTYTEQSRVVVDCGGGGGGDVISNPVPGGASGPTTGLAGAYFVGTGKYDGGTSGPGYYHNGAWTLLDLPAGAQSGTAVAGARSGVDLYIIGTAKDAAGVDAAGYWKNGTWTEVPSLASDQNCYPSSILVDGSDIYIGGTCKDATGTKVAGYWENGVWTGLNTYGTGNLANEIGGIQKDGDDLYVAGNSDNGTGMQVATVWKNGTPTRMTFPNASQVGPGMGLGILDGDVYVGSGFGDATNIEIGYFKNGTWTSLKQRTLVSTKGAWSYRNFAKLDGSIYTVFGIAADRDVLFTSYYAKDGVTTELPPLATGKSCFAAGVAADGRGVFVSGSCKDEAGTDRMGCWEIDGAGTFTPLDEKLEVGGGYVFF